MSTLVATNLAHPELDVSADVGRILAGAIAARFRGTGADGSVFADAYNIASTTDRGTGEYSWGLNNGFTATFAMVYLLTNSRSDSASGVCRDTSVHGTSTIAVFTFAHLNTLADRETTVGVTGTLA